jgi:hypothetical protein
MIDGPGSGPEPERNPPHEEEQEGASSRGGPHPRRGQQPGAGEQRGPDAGETDFDAEVRRFYDDLPKDTRDKIEAAEANDDLYKLLFYSLTPQTEGYTSEEDYQELENEVSRLRENLRQKAENNDDLKEAFRNIPLPIPGEQPSSAWNLIENTMPKREDQDEASKEFNYELLPEAFRSKWAGKGINEYEFKLLHAYGINPQTRPSGEKWSEADKDKIRVMLTRNPSLVEEFTQVRQQLGQQSTPPESPDDSIVDKGAKEVIENNQERMRKAQEKIDAILADPNLTDAEKRHKAFEAIEEEKMHHTTDAKHGAEYLEKTNSTLANILKGLGIAFYCYLALQWMAASVLEKYGQGDSGGKR